MHIQRTAASLSRKWASNAVWAPLTDGDSCSSVCDAWPSEPDSVDVSIYNGPDPNPKGKSRYDYTVTLSGREIVELLLKLNPAAIAPAVASILRYQPEVEKQHRDAGARIPVIVQQLIQGLYSSMRTEQRG